MMDIPNKKFTEDDAPKHMDNVECLDWAEGANYGYEYLRQQLAEQTGEPVAWQFLDESDGRWYLGMNNNNHKQNTIDGGYKVRDLYTAPPSVEVLLEALRKIASGQWKSHVYEKIASDVLNAYKPTEG